MRAKAAASLAAATFLLGACGGDDSAAETAPSAQQGQSDGSGGQERPDGSQGGAGRADGAARGPERSGGDTSARFTPRQHSDSGGGAQQFRVRGGDNSVQNFGSEAEGSDFEQAATALHNFFDARAQRAWAAACRHLAAGLVASLEGRGSPDAEPQMSCARGLAQMTNSETRELQRKEARIDVGSLRAEGEQGFLLYRDAEGIVYAIAMQREDGEWKVANLAGLPLM